MKTCKVCKTEKNITEFYWHPNYKDNHVKTCKTCVNERKRAQYAVDKEVETLTQNNDTSEDIRARRIRLLTELLVAFGADPWKAVELSAVAGGPLVVTEINADRSDTVVREYELDS